MKTSKYSTQLDELRKLLPKLQIESELGVVLILCSYLDSLLRDMLLAFLIESRSTTRLLGGPLRDFGARIIAAYSMGIINKDEICLLNDIKDIRNRFAHEYDMNFDDEEIKKLCDKLLSKHMGKDIAPMPSNLKLRTVAIDLITKFGNRVDYLKDKKLKTEDWNTAKW